MMKVIESKISELTARSNAAKPSLIAPFLLEDFTALTDMQATVDVSNMQDVAKMVAFIDSPAFIFASYNYPDAISQIQAIIYENKRLASIKADYIRVATRDLVDTSSRTALFKSRGFALGSLATIFLVGLIVFVVIKPYNQGGSN